MDALKSNFGKTLAAIALILLLLVGSVAYLAWYNLFREVPTEYASAEDNFKYGSMGTEEAEGMPYWIWVVLPRLFPEKLPQAGGYTAVGLTWEEGKETPIGISKKIIGFERQGITCAICHTATYRKTDKDKPTFVLAGPGNQFDAQAYQRFLFDCANDPRFTADYILPEIEYNHHLSGLDKLLYRYLLIPQTKKAILKQQQSYAWMYSRPNWGPGRIDPFNPVKFRTLALPLDNTIGNSDMMPIWNEKQHQGFVYHWDGLETSLTETVQTGAIGDGATRQSIDLAGLERVEAFIKDAQPPKYPFAIDSSLSEQGKAIFDNNCATCHAFGGERTGTVIPVSEVGTDRHRLDMWTQEAAEAYNAFADGYSYDFNHVQKTDGYISPSLEGLWLRAPYLHNGSVPYLGDLLEVPDQRTKVFYRGYNVYNSDKVGFVSEGTQAERQGWKYDTNVEANSNQGHLYGTDLGTDDKKALVEYLKTL